MELSILILMSLLFCGKTLSHSSGAKESSCDSMYPHHKHYRAKTTSCPFVAHPEKTEMFANSSLQVTLQSRHHSNEAFKGYLIMAVNKDDPDGPAIGYFKVPSGSHTLDCHGGKQNAATHSSKSHDSHVKLTWFPPVNFNGRIIFKTTFVSKKSIFWVGEISETIEIGFGFNDVQLESYEISFDELVLIWIAYSLFIVLMVLVIWYCTYVVKCLKATKVNLNSDYVNLKY